MGNSTSAADKKAVVTSLLQSILTGDLESTSSLILRFPELLTTALDLDIGHNPIHMAVLVKGHTILSYLLSFCSHINSSCNGQLEASLHSCAMKALNDCHVATPLMLACDLGDLESVRLLLEAGAVATLTDRPHQRTCLHYAAARGHADVIELVIQKNQARNRVSSEITAFSRLSWQDEEESNRPLVDVATICGFTPLMYAAWFDHPQAVVALMRNGSSIRRRTLRLGVGSDIHCTNIPDGSTALHVAAIANSHKAALSILGEYIHAQQAYAMYQAEDRLAVGRGDPRPAPMARPIDPRLYVDSNGRNSFVMARILDHVELMNTLNPFTPLAAAIDAVEVEHRPVVIPTLQQLAAKVAQILLRSQLEVLSKRIADRKQAKSGWRMQAGGSSVGRTAQSVEQPSPTIHKRVPSEPPSALRGTASSVMTTIFERASQEGVRRHHSLNSSPSNMTAGNGGGFDRLGSLPLSIMPSVTESNERSAVEEGEDGSEQPSPVAGSSSQVECSAAVLEDGSKTSSPAFQLLMGTEAVSPAPVNVVVLQRRVAFVPKKEEEEEDVTDCNCSATTARSFHDCQQKHSEDTAAMGGHTTALGGHNIIQHAGHEEGLRSASLDAAREKLGPDYEVGIISDQRQALLLSHPGQEVPPAHQQFISETPWSPAAVAGGSPLSASLLSPTVGSRLHRANSAIPSLVRPSFTGSSRVSGDGQRPSLRSAIKSWRSAALVRVSAGGGVSPQASMTQEEILTCLPPLEASPASQLLLDDEAARSSATTTYPSMMQSILGSKNVAEAEGIIEIFITSDVTSPRVSSSLSCRAASRQASLTKPQQGAAAATAAAAALWSQRSLRASRKLLKMQNQLASHLAEQEQGLQMLMQRLLPDNNQAGNDNSSTKHPNSQRGDHLLSSEEQQDFQPQQRNDARTQLSHLHHKRSLTSIPLGYEVVHTAPHKMVHRKTASSSHLSDPVMVDALISVASAIGDSGVGVAQLEETLIACRYHRLVYGVNSHAATFRLTPQNTLQSEIKDDEVPQLHTFHTEQQQLGGASKFCQSSNGVAKGGSSLMLEPQHSTTGIKRSSTDLSYASCPPTPLGLNKSILSPMLVASPGSRILRQADNSGIDKNETNLVYSEASSPFLGVGTLSSRGGTFGGMMEGLGAVRVIGGAEMDSIQMGCKVEADALDNALPLTGSSPTAQTSLPRLLSSLQSFDMGSSLGDPDEYEDMCGVCLDEGDFIKTSPCQHKLCVSCALELLKLHPLDPIPCPFCRCLLRGFQEHRKAAAI
ncbi:hypothetical protein CEUSTIGMA_g6354.t1 [Chlamydomonas eustigma]|uniref:RING-type domain-containing protein n=1 Tax=Chlamydomonas eustigma TaxID=1157962 RepID=A0A250X774_9CHLO|nr:hypothetical protein CEUSTIGMA_g6354.t1 [Chlamydomonas eustigma]|eukprot:GAX78915.1 hypothetical protein CEUSTIGMA_g6354.t1 [Chlamydomonas eustigma]